MKVSSNMAQIKKMKIGNPIKRLVSTRSMLREMSTRWRWEVVRTSLTMLAMKP